MVTAAHQLRDLGSHVAVVELRGELALLHDFRKYYEDPDNDLLVAERVRNGHREIAELASDLPMVLHRLDHLAVIGNAGNN